MTTRLVLIENLSCTTLLLSIILRLFNYKIIYFHMIPFLRNSQVMKWLNKIDIHIIDYSKFERYDVKEFYETNMDLSEKVYDELFGDLSSLQAIGKYIRVLNGNQKLSKAILLDTINKYVSNYQNLHISSKYFSGSFSDIYIICNQNIIRRILIKKSEYINQSVMFTIFSYVYKFNHYSILLIRAVVSKSFKSRKNREGKIASKDAVNVNDNSYKVVFFPHKGLSYGSLFSKDYYYEESNEWLTKKNILHVEYSQGMTSGSISKIEENYRKNELSYTFIGGISIRTKLSFLLKYFALLIKGEKIVLVLRKNELARQYVQATLYVLFSYYYNYIRQYSNLKLALVGYDCLFPKTLYLALKQHDVVTVGVQERYLLPMAKNYNVFLDYYFVWGQTVADKMKQKNSSYCECIINIGPIRIDKLKSNAKKDANKKEAGLSKVILVFDLHSEKDYISDKEGMPFVNWVNNLAFYKDIINLSKEFPEFTYIIRGKNSDWYELPYFKQVRESIERADNIIVNQDYTKEYVSYALAQKADLIISRHTSIADECLAAGKNVIIHDYSPNSERLFSSIYDYSNVGVFVYSYKELRQKVMDYINSGKILYDNNILKKLYYGYPNCIAQQILQDNLHTITNSLMPE